MPSQLKERLIKSGRGNGAQGSEQSRMFLPLPPALVKNLVGRASVPASNQFKWCVKRYENYAKQT
jgi:hypothetical protein